MVRDLLSALFTCLFRLIEGVLELLPGRVAQQLVELACTPVFLSDESQLDSTIGGY